MLLDGRSGLRDERGVRIGNRRVPGQNQVCRGFPSVDDLGKGSTSTICSMRTPRRRLSPDDRRAELLALGAEVFGQRPYDEVRIDEIAERAGVSRALMYHYFPDKRAFFAAVVKGQADQLFETTNTPATPGQNLFEEVRGGVLAYMQYHQEHPHAAWAAYVGLGRSDPVLLGIDDEAKDRQMEHIMSRVMEVDGSGNPLDPIVERDLRIVIHGWLALTFEVCRQRIIHPDTDAGHLSDTCAHALLDAIIRVDNIPDRLAKPMAADQRYNAFVVPRCHDGWVTPMPDDALARFSVVTRDWFAGTFAAPTPAQAEAWSAIADGQNTLVIAPTGSGKTLAAFLWAIDALAGAPRSERSAGTRVLYVSPLKALAVDVERNLRTPLAGMARVAAQRGLTAPEITVGLRSGDPSPARRRQLISNPPDVLITTPESLFLMLTSAARQTLAGVQTVIVDEVHAIAGTKRGAHLALSLERLDDM